MTLPSLPNVPQPARQALRPLALLTVLGLVSATALHWLVLVPAQDTLARTQAAYEEARRQSIQLKQNRHTQEHVRDLERELDHVWAKLPAEPEFASLAIEISEVARSVGVSVPGMTYSHKKAEEGLPAKASLVFQATGKYKDIYAFIHKLETMEPHLAIEQLDASRATEADARRRGAVQFNVRVVTFLKRQPDTGATS